MDWVMILGNMHTLGLFEFIFPFLLILAIAYGVLRYSLKDVLPKSAAGLVSIIIAFFVMNYSGTVGYQLSKFFSTLFGGGLIVASAILMVVIILGLLGLKIGDIVTGEKNKKVTGAFVAAVLFIVFLIAVGASGSYIPWISPITLTQDFWTIIFFIIILVVVLWVLGREEEKGGAAEGGEK